MTTAASTRRLFTAGYRIIDGRGTDVTVAAIGARIDSFGDLRRYLLNGRRLTDPEGYDVTYTVTGVSGGVR